MIVDLKSTPHKTPRLIVEGGLVVSKSDGIVKDLNEALAA
ncbi:hypothetical protein PITCH_A160004 [uncultured Desulfobacterium sp.]|uniref:Uncharacterized protein n=1 Tax=uncultured Desulfobacterium sp. TaxID=201089 RepID=A0A445MU51_9BACT|nr:hypothetical protein PITCH_A160004 [uncultured Desulfobacterium sp.]